MRLFDRGADPYVPGHGDRSYRVEHYDLTLTYRVADNHLSGRALLRCVAQEPTDTVSIDLHQLAVSRMKVDGRRVGYRRHRSTVSVSLSAPLAKGDAFELELGYAGHPTPVPDRVLGPTGWEELDDGSIVAGQPHGAPSWFPCNDRPDDKAGYRVTVSAPSAYRVVGNGELVSRTRRASSTTWVWEQREPMATYLATLHVGRYRVIDVDAVVPLRIVVPQRLVSRQAVALGRQPDMLAAFVDLFGPYPFGSYTVVVTDDELEIPLESQGLSTFGSNALVGGWEAERLVAHELAHQWFGNSVTLGSWRDIWLHEGFACYAEWLWSEWSGRGTAHEHAVRHRHRLAELDQDLVLGDPGPHLMFDDRVYKRGALLLHSLRLTVGDDLFFGLLTSWTSEYAYATASTDDFIELAQRSVGRSLAALFAAWLRETDLPQLPPPPAH